MYDVLLCDTKNISRDVGLVLTVFNVTILVGINYHSLMNGIYKI